MPPDSRRFGQRFRHDMPGLTMKQAGHLRSQKADHPGPTASTRPSATLCAVCGPLGGRHQVDDHAVLTGAAHGRNRLLHGWPVYAGARARAERVEHTVRSQ